jgi:hypothetical protein
VDDSAMIMLLLFPYSIIAFMALDGLYRRLREAGVRSR